MTLMLCLNGIEWRRNISLRFYMHDLMMLNHDPSHPKWAYDSTHDPICLKIKNKRGSLKR